MANPTFPRVRSWQRWGEGEYVTDLELMNGTVDGDKDGARAVLDTLKAGGAKDLSVHVRGRHRPRADR